MIPRWLSGKESACQCKRPGFHPRVGKIPWRRKWQAIPIFFPGESMDRGAWGGYSLCSHKRVRYDLVTKQHFSSVAQSCLTLCDPMNHSRPGLPVHHPLPESTQTHVHWVSDVIQPSHPLSSPSLPAFNLSQHQGLFQWVTFSHQVAKVLELQLQHQSFQWTPRSDLL